MRIRLTGLAVASLLARGALAQSPSDERRRGVGAALLDAAERRAVNRGASQLRVETQQINVPACRFYLRHGFSLESVRPDAYPDLPEEVQLLWRKSLALGSRSSG